MVIGKVSAAGCHRTWGFAETAPVRINFSSLSPKNYKNTPSSHTPLSASPTILMPQILQVDGEEHEEQLRNLKDARGTKARYKNKKTSRHPQKRNDNGEVRTHESEDTAWGTAISKAAE